MIGWIVSSSILILIIIAIRHFFSGKISLCMQYALWLIVLARLMMPFSPGKNPASVSSVIPVEMMEQQMETAGVQIPISSFGGMPGSVSEEVSNGNNDTYVLNLTLVNICKTIWLCGVFVVATVLLISNLSFARKLRWARRPAGIEKGQLPVYVVDFLKTPCMFGFFKPSVYITPKLMDSPEKLNHVITHERTHYRHKDHWWALFRGVCIAMHWYNPLVWIAAILSRKDSELACDESTIKKIGENSRMEYGRTLIELATEKTTARDILCCATTMTISNGGLKERITLIAKRPKMLAVTATTVLMVCAVAAGCTFMGADRKAHIEESGTKLDVVLSNSDYAELYKAPRVETSKTSGSDIASIITDCSLDNGVKVMFYRAKNGDIFGAYQKKDGLIIFTQEYWADEKTGYESGYSIHKYSNVLGQSGFYIVCQRGAAYIAYDYYYFDEDGELSILAECSNHVGEKDLNGDGDLELYWFYHGTVSDNTDYV